MLHTALLFVLTLAASDPEVTLSGTVVDTDGKPAGGAELFLADGPTINSRVGALRQGDVPARPKIVARARSDDTGSFAIGLPEEVPESDWARRSLVLWVRHAGSALSTYPVGRDWPPRAAPVEVRLAAAPSLPLVIVGPDERPLPKARVLPEQVNGLRLPRELAEQLASTTDDAGRVTLHGVAPPGLDLVRVESPEYGVQWASLPAADAGGARRVALLPVAVVRGRLTGDDPRAIAAIPIRLATWLTAGDDLAGGGLAETITDAEGRFEVPAIAAGALSVVPQLRAELPFRCHQVTGRPVAEGIASELTINLERAVRVEGVVRDRESGEPLAGAAVWLDRFVSPDDDPRSDERGRYGALLLPGQASPSFRRIPRNYYFPEYTLDSQPVPEGAARVELRPLRLARGVAVRGRVVDRRGKGVGGAEIEARWDLASGGENSAHGRSDRDGGFTLEGVAPNVQLKLSAFSAQGTTREAVAVHAAAQKPLELVVDPSNTTYLEGRVVDTEKRPIAGAVVRIAWQRRGAEGRAEDEGYVEFGGGQRLLTDADGRFRTPAVLARGREYRVEAFAGGMLPAVTEFIDPTRMKTPALGNLVLDRVPALRAIDGRVIDRRGEPVAGLKVFQTGDGPRCTQTVTDEEGRFRLPGLNLGPVFLLASGDGYPLQGFLLAGDVKPVELTVRRESEPPMNRLSSLEEPLTRAQRRAAALRLVEPIAASVKQVGVQPEKIWLMATLATLDPSRISDFAGLAIFKLLGAADFAEQFRFQAAAAMLPEDLAEALALGEAISSPHHRGRLYLAASASLTDEERQQKEDLLASALLHARAEPDVAQRAELMGKIAEAWLDLGEVERGTALLREGEKLAEQLPVPSEAAQRAHELAPHLRARFAGSLARIDGPAAIKLSAGFTGQFADRYWAGVARGLAGYDPTAAERLLDELEFSTALYWQALPVLYRMAGADADRAARLAPKCEEISERGYALGIVASGLVQGDAARARTLLDEAFGLFERAAAEGAGPASAREHPAVLAAALLPVVERVDALSLEDCLWRAMALRSPRAARTKANHDGAIVTAALAMFLSRYDRAAARALAAPIAERGPLLTAGGEHWTSRLAWGSLAVVDATWAESLVDTLPDPPTLDLRSAKNVARRCVAEALAPSEKSWWHKPYELTGLRDPDARDDEQ